jgi:hypothetical protein
MTQRLRALQRDPEYVLVYLRHRDVVIVLSEFWRSWSDAEMRAAPGETSVGLQREGEQPRPRGWDSN